MLHYMAALYILQYFSSICGRETFNSQPRFHEALSLPFPADMPEPVRSAEPESAADRPAFLFQTSGTTGEAKRVKAAHVLSERCFWVCATGLEFKP
ncbi:MAG: hypothetical protein D3904_11460 [Candidatus Electrothrix sp. EH2]|nr:hypothetical protein [Candidatus Electrothrix sp. EH2]